MSNLPQSDWILAGRYVDGDLSASESAKAKSRLESDEDFAAAVEEIRTQSSLFGSLPNFTPSTDLEDRTLQASLDQVKAIMGAWPMTESDAAKVSVANRESAESFDWKSTVALVASLAGVLMIGSMLWQNRTGTGNNLAMERAGRPVAPSVQGKAAGMDSVLPNEKLPEFEESEMNESLGGSAAFGATETSPAAEKSDRAFDRKIESPIAKDESAIAKKMPDIGPIMGTPAAKRSMPPEAAPAEPEAQDMQIATNVSSPVEQVWCVSQDKNISRNAVCDILASNSIQVQREEQPRQNLSNAEPVEAFYIAATPKQMKLAMSQISNNADIEMIQLPKIANSPIADVIAKQFSGNQSAMKTPIQQQRPANIAPGFKEPSPQALAQQLVSNAFPRNFVPSGPLPPILESGTPIDGLDKEAKKDQSDLGKEALANSKSKAAEAIQQQKAVPLPSIAAVPNATAAPNAIAKGGGIGGGGAGFGGGGHTRQVDSIEASAAMQQSNLSLPQQAELDKYLDDKDQQLRQYLILVRGGEAENE